MTHGDRVTFTEVLHRRTFQRWNPAIGRTQTRKEWIVSNGPPLVGVFLGWRTLRDGVRRWSNDDQMVFTPDGPTIKAAMVSFSGRRNPVYVSASTLTRSLPTDRSIP